VDEQRHTQLEPDYQVRERTPIGYSGLMTYRLRYGITAFSTQVERVEITPSLPTYNPLLHHIALVLQAVIEGERAEWESPRWGVCPPPRHDCRGILFSCVRRNAR